MLKIFGFKGSGNCLKVYFVARHLAIEHEWIEVDSIRGDTRREEFLALNPVGQVPIVQFDDGRVLSQSNAILLYLARDSPLVPGDPWRLALVQQWLFWEQYSHEPYIAVCRAEKRFRGKSDADLDPEKVRRGNVALDLMEDHLSGREWLVEGSGPTVADVSLVAYTRVADEGGFKLESRPSVRAWIARVEQALAIDQER